MTRKQELAFSKLQETVMAYVHMAAAIDKALKEIEIEIDNPNIDYAYAVLFIRSKQLYLQDVKKHTFGSNLEMYGNKWWDDLLSTFEKKE